MADQKWILEGWDTFARESYPISGEFTSEADAVAAAHRQLEELERMQPSESSGGQAGIQDQVFVVGPAGQRYRVVSSPQAGPAVDQCPPEVLAGVLCAGGLRSDGSVAWPSFSEFLAAIQRDCGWEQVPHDTIAALAVRCGPAEIDQLIRELDALDDADLVDDAGDVGDEYWRLRTSYSDVLAKVGEPAIDPLLRALKSSNPQTRYYAARALGLIGSPRAFDPLVASLAEEHEVPTRWGLIEALGRIADARAVPILLPYLQGQGAGVRRDGHTIRSAANALGMIGTADVIQPLSQILATDPDWFVRLGAAEGLGKIHHPLATEALRRALQDPDPRVRAEALAALQRRPGITVDPE
jgi:hypothetical protein